MISAPDTSLISSEWAPTDGDDYRSGDGRDDGGRDGPEWSGPDRWTIPSEPDQTAGPNAPRRTVPDGTRNRLEVFYDSPAGVPEVGRPPRGGINLPPATINSRTVKRAADACRPLQVRPFTPVHSSGTLHRRGRGRDER